jgi:hypothetical protein
MTAPIRHGALGVLTGLALACAGASMLVLVGAGAARAAGVTDARISTSYVMHGRVTTAIRVRGEHRGQRVTRRWTFTGLSCTGSVCEKLALRRQRSAHRYDRLTLSRVGVGSYAGSGRFYVGLRCRGRRYRRGLVVPYRITVEVAQAVAVQSIAFAGQLTATYTTCAASTAPGARSAPATTRLCIPAPRRPFPGRPLSPSRRPPSRVPTASPSPTPRNRARVAHRSWAGCGSSAIRLRAPPTTPPPRPCRTPSRPPGPTRCSSRCSTPTG